MSAVRLTRVVAAYRANTSLQFRVIEGFPDYHPERPGGRPGGARGGRSIIPELFPYRRLGDWAARVTAFPDTPALLALSRADTGNPLQVHFPPEVVDRIETDDLRFGGAALVGGLLEACLERGIVPVTGARAVELVAGRGGVTGVVIESGGRQSEVRAQRGVILATGGFEWDESLVREFLRGPVHGAASPPFNTGDGLRMAMKVGAALGNMREAWWIPVVKIPAHEAWGEQRNTIILSQRTRPRCIMVNKFGERFANEAANYNAMGASFHQFDVTRFDYTNIPAWMVFDADHLRAYGFLTIPPGGEAPAWFNPSASLADLAVKIGANPAGLESTVASWNEYADKGVDPDFGRGDSSYDWWWGDWTKEGTGRTLGRIDTPPYFAVQVHGGTLGTKGGPQTNSDGEVIDVDGQTISGLYAAGNAMAGTTGMVYGGAGGTIGPAMVWGLRAGRNAGRRPERSLNTLRAASS
jgi:3-oxosteroid 1-dehydrogenase